MEDIFLHSRTQFHSHFDEAAFEQIYFRPCPIYKLFLLNKIEKL